MKIFLTGGTGFLGSHTAEELIKRGHEVFALVRPTSQKDFLSQLQVSLVEGSLSDCKSLIPLLNQVDAVVHVAGIVKAKSKSEFYRVNAQGTANLVQAMLQARPRPKRLIHISTIAVHNPQGGKDYCLPAEICAPLTYYGQSKREAELALEPLKGKIRTIILRPPALYGPRDQEFLPIFKSIQKGFGIFYQKGENQFSLCHGADVASAIADLTEAELEKDEIFCLDDGEIHSWKSLQTQIAQLLQKTVTYLNIPSPLFYAAAGISQVAALITQKPLVFNINKMKELKQKRWVCGSEKIRSLVGWEPKISLQSGLKDTLNFYQDSGLINVTRAF